MYSIPFEIPFVYMCPQVDTVPDAMHVDALDLSPIESERLETVEAAIETYLVAYQAQFVSQYGIVRRKRFLYRFLEYLKSQQHSLKLIDLTLEDGQAFLHTLVNAYNEKSLSSITRDHYRKTLRMFGRFLANSNLIAEDIFFSLISR